MTPDDLLKEALESAVVGLFGKSADLQIQPTNPQFEGSHTLVCFPLTKLSGKSPEETGKLIGEAVLKGSDTVSSFNVVKGFLNFVLSDKVWSSRFNQINANPSFGTFSPNGKEIMVEYSSPNTNKPLHLGHLRNNFLGFAVAEIYRAIGYKVHRVQIINDRGIHICKSMAAWKLFGNAETPASASVKGDHLVGKYYVLFDRHYKEQTAELEKSGLAKEQAEKEAPIMKLAVAMLQQWENRDPEILQLWQTMNGWVYEGFGKTYERMGVSFDKLYYESETYLLGKEEVLKGLESGVFFKKEDGSVWVDLTADGLDQKVLLRSDGTSVYMTQDIGTAILRFRDFPSIDGQVYTVGNEQEYHFKVLFLILKKLGFKWAEKCFHLSYGMVDLPTGKMKSREGTVVDADDLMEEMVQAAAKQSQELGKAEPSEATNEMIGLGALKYFLLKVDPKKRMLFDPNESIQMQGNTAPFIQYTHARIRALIRKAEEQNLNFSGSFSGIKLEPGERALISLISRYPETITLAASGYSPSVVANYAYELAKEYNQFYQTVRIFGEQDNQTLLFRIALSAQTAKIIRHAMALLGIGCPEKM
ncbi:MAG: arginine--tRNA ligase [Bacteroidetes bacterium]|nr:arginine--tRNA ligase [Bacteroidota bacterium]